MPTLEQVREKGRLVPLGRTPGTGGESFAIGGYGGGGSPYNPSKEEVEELALREKAARRGTTLPKNMLDMTMAERLEMLRKIAAQAQAQGGGGAQFKRETSPFGNVMRLGF